MARLIEVLQRTRPAPSGEYTWPAPVAGINARDSLANMPVEFAVQLVNLLPDNGFVASRHGSRRHARISLQHGVVIDSAPPRLVSPVQQQILPAGHPFQFTLIEFFADESQALEFALADQPNTPEWVDLDSSGVVSGTAPQPENDEGFVIPLRVSDASANHVDFDLRLLVLRRQPPLHAPANFTAERPTDDAALVEIAWDRVEDAEHYEIETRQDADHWDAPDLIEQTSAARIGAEAVLEGDDWRVRVRATALGRVPSEWAELEVADQYIPPPPVDPPPPNQLATVQNLRASRPDGTNTLPILFQWDPVADATHYELRSQVGNSPDPATDTLVVIVSTTEYRTSAYSSDAEATLYVVAIASDFAASEPSEGVQLAYFRSQQLSTPTSLTISRTPSEASRVIHIFWNASPNAGRYEVQHRLNGGAWEQIATTDSFVTQHQHPYSEEDPGTGWEVRVRALDNLPSWSASDWTSARVPPRTLATVAAPLPLFDRLDDGLGQTVRVTMPRTVGVRTFRYQIRQGSDDWSDDHELANPESGTVSADHILPGANWTFRWVEFETEQGWQPQPYGII